MRAINYSSVLDAEDLYAAGTKLLGAAIITGAGLAVEALIEYTTQSKINALASELTSQLHQDALHQHIKFSQIKGNIDNIKSQIDICANNYHLLARSFIKTFLTSGIAISGIISFNKELMLASISMEVLKFFIDQKLSHSLKKANINLQNITLKIASMRHSQGANAFSIIAEGGQDFIISADTELVKQQLSAKQKVLYLQQRKDLISRWLYNIKSAGITIYLGSLFASYKSHEKRSELYGLLSAHLINFVQLPNVINANITNSVLAQNALHKIRSALEAYVAPHSWELDVNYDQHSQNLLIQNLTITLHHSKKIFTDFEFKAHQFNALLGSNGCGKSLLLSILGGVYSDLITVSGQLSLPCQKSKIVFIPQDDFFPQNLSCLLEAIYYPQQLPESEAERLELRKQVMQMMGELNLNLNLDSNKFRLSGGEMKKCKLISAILREPQMLLLDEVFSPMDPESIVLSQRLLKSRLPECTVIIIDHNHRRDNWGTNFYDNIVNLDNHVTSSYNATKSNLEMAI